MDDRRRYDRLYVPRGRYATLPGGTSTYAMRLGNRRQVFAGRAHRTAGGLLRGDLMLNPRHHVVSRRRHDLALRQNHLRGYLGWSRQNPLVRRGIIRAPLPPQRRRWLRR